MGRPSTSYVLQRALAVLPLAMVLMLGNTHAASGSPQVPPVAEVRERSQGESTASASDRSIKKLMGEATAAMNKARDTGDVRYYDAAQNAVDRAFKLDPQSFEATRMQAWVFTGRHRFSEALTLARRASAKRPSDSATYGIMVDALVELGRYEEAVDACQKMTDLLPSMGAYTRISNLRWLYGDPEGAEEMSRLAIDAGQPGSPETAWCIVQLGNQEFDQGRLNAAQDQYQRALTTVPRYAPAIAGLGRVAAARRDYPQAIVAYKKAAALSPADAYQFALYDLYQVTHRRSAARKTLDRIESSAKAHEGNPETALKMAIFYTNHDMRRRASLHAAEQDVTSANDIAAWDAVAWARYKNGKYAAADAAMKKALRLGTKDARLFFHAGMIAEARGDHIRAVRQLSRSLDTNPYFDLREAAIASATLRDISAGRMTAERRRAVIRSAVPATLGLLAMVVAAALGVVTWKRRSR